MDLRKTARHNLVEIELKSQLFTTTTASQAAQRLVPQHLHVYTPAFSRRERDADPFFSGKRI